jgi:hypothetical protein
MKSTPGGRGLEPQVDRPPVEFSLFSQDVEVVWSKKHFNRSLDKRLNKNIYIFYRRLWVNIPVANIIKLFKA